MTRAAATDYPTLRSLEPLFEDRYVEINGLRFFYRIANPDADRTIVKLHGVTGNSFDMLKTAYEWVRCGYRVVLPDMPGHDRSPDMPIERFSDLADWLHDFVEATNQHRPPVAIVGNSFGSAVCYTMAARHGLPEGTMLFLGCPTPTVASISRAIQFMSDFVPEGIARALYLNRAVIQVRIAYLLARNKDKEARELLTESELNKVDTVHVAYAGTVSGMLLKEQPYKHYALPTAIQERTVVIIGGKDNIVTPSSTAVLHRLLPQAKFKTIPYSGHILHLEAYRDVAGIVDQELS